MSSTLTEHSKVRMHSCGRNGTQISLTYFEIANVKVTFCKRALACEKLAVVFHNSLFPGEEDEPGCFIMFLDNRIESVFGELVLWHSEMSWLSVMLRSHIKAVAQVPAALLLNQLPADVLWDSRHTWASVTHVDLDATPGFNMVQLHR